MNDHPDEPDTLLNQSALCPKCFDDVQSKKVWKCSALSCLFTRWFFTWIRMAMVHPLFSGHPRPANRFRKAPLGDQCKFKVDFCEQNHASSSSAAHLADRCSIHSAHRKAKSLCLVHEYDAGLSYRVDHWSFHHAIALAITLHVDDDHPLFGGLGVGMDVDLH